MTLDIPAELAKAGFVDAEEIGHGGFGTVYRCQQPSLDRVVAVKVLTQNLESENLARFLREQHAMGKLSGHPNIINIFQIGKTDDDGLPFIVMQYHSQGSLEARIRGFGPLDWTDALRLGVRLAGALETAHRIGILHRDVKPANILLTDYGEPQLADFGIAHMVGGFETATGVVTGSPAFTAPEIIRGDTARPVSDVYSLAATLFSALTGHAAVERHNDERVVAHFVRITTDAVSDLRGREVPDDFCAAIEIGMATDPDDRPASAIEFGQRLRGIERRHDCSVDAMAVPTRPGAQRHEGTDNDGWSFSPSAGVGADSRTGPQPESRSTLTGRRHLPLELTSFVGRRRELAKAKTLLAASRLVTLTGMGGVGKTRLALHVAAELERTFDDGVWLVELGELQDAELLANTVADALSLRAQSGRPVENLVDYLRTRRLLIVLDNCEQIVEAVAELAENLLRICPELHFLVTSREPLGVGGETTLRVPPLSAPGQDKPHSPRGLGQYEAVALFTDRAITALPEFEITDDNYQFVAEICQRLDGLPLALELAAARMRSLSAAQILQRLTDRYRLLTLGYRGAPARQQTLRLSIDWSYDLCSPDEKYLWARLSVFAGSFETDAAEDICAGNLSSGDLLDTLARLVDKSILVRESCGTTVRYRILETLREYGHEKLLESGEERSLRRQHMKWYERLVLRAEAEWISPSQREWAARLEREQSNLRDAMQYRCSEPDEIGTGLSIVSALYPFWLARGLINEGRRCLDLALSCQDDHPTLSRVKALYANSVLAGLQGNIRAATKMVEEAIDIAEQLDTTAQALSLNADGLLAFHTGDLTRAVSCFDRALETFRSEGDLLRTIEILIGLALVGELNGDTASAIACNEEVLTITERTGDSFHRVYSLWSLGLALRHSDPRRGVSLLKESLKLARVLDDPLATAWCLEALSWIAFDENRFRRAVVLIGAAETLWHTLAAPAMNIPAFHTNHDQYKQRSRSLLGEKPFEAAFHEGESLNLPCAVAYALEEKSPASSPVGADGLPSLTRREGQVAELVAQGLTNRAIAAKLVISQRTAQGHVEHILTKLGFTSRTQIAAWVIEQKAT
ncbi:protein kinase [Rhodococcus sp. NPDC059968]|uniref:protein kinase domain-containing protein n=1 Tax=Rhodococcus sp. NPDC059968 TaxID=3347017 RepID=UPI00366CB039